MDTTAQTGGPLRRLARLLGFRSSRTPESSTPTSMQRPPAVRREWASLPPLRTSLHRPLPETSHVTRFSAGVRSHLATPASLAPLGHDVAMDAPKGIATGIARAVRAAARPGLADLPLADLARPGGPRPRWGDEPPMWPAAIAAGTDSLSSADGPAGPAVGTSSVMPAPESAAAVPATTRVLRSARTATPPVGAPTAPRPEGLTLRRVRTIPTSGRGPMLPVRQTQDRPSGTGRERTPSSSPLPEEPPTLPDRPTVGAAPIVPPSFAPSRPEPGGTTDAPQGVGRNVHELRPAGPAASPSPGRSGPSVQRRPDRPPSGVGPLLHELPTTARPVTREQRSAATSVTGRGQREAIEKGLERLIPPSPPQTRPPAERAAEAPITASLQPRPEPLPPGPPVPARPLPPRRAHGVVQRAVPPAPLVGARRPLASRHADAAARESGHAGPERGAAPDNGEATGASEQARRSVIPVRWQPPEVDVVIPEKPGSLRAATRRSSASASVSRSAVAHPSTATSPPAGRTPPEVRRTRAGEPVRSGSMVTSDEPAVPVRWRSGPAAASTTPAAFDGRSGPGERPFDLALPRLPGLMRATEDVGAGPRETATAPADGGPEVAATRSPGPASPPAVQRQVEAAPAPGTASSDAEPSGGEAGTDINEVFRKLYPRVRDELRWELRVQRERAGMLSDPL